MLWTLPIFATFKGSLESYKNNDDISEQDTSCSRSGAVGEVKLQTQ